MTRQFLDLCEFEGKRWGIGRHRGQWPVPSSSSLGFRTESKSSANRSGRIDVFGIDPDGVLRLRAIEARLAEHSRDVFVPGARRTQLNPESYGLDVRFEFEDRPVPFSGTMTLVRDESAEWHPRSRDPNAFEHRAILRFRDGKLVEHRLEQGRRPGRVTLRMVLWSILFYGLCGGAIWRLFFA